MPNKKRNKNNRQGNPDNRQSFSHYHHHHHSHGIQKKHYQKGGYNHNERRNAYIAPHLITDDFDENIDQDQHKQQARTSSKSKRDKNRRNAFMSKFDDMAIIRDKPKKLSIGDTDTEPKKILLPSQPHCKLAGVPEDVFSIVVKFLQDYFTCYDSNREALLAAYNPKVLFSMAVNTSPNNVHRVINFDGYMKESRNLKRLCVTDEFQFEKRFKLLHEGHLETVNIHTKLPPTQHEPSSFKLDLYFFTPQMISFSVNGVLKEGKETDKVRPYRSFQRVFVCIPDAHTGMSIVNEQYILANIQTSQYKLYYREKDMSLKSTPQESTPASLVTVTNDMSFLNECNDTQKQMINEFSKHSNLNIRWSFDCLRQVDWNFNEAARLFMEYKSQIPSSAYLTQTS